jgi:hypothetical protein
MTVKFKIGSVYKIQQSISEWMYLDDYVKVNLHKTLFLCIEKDNLKKLTKSKLPAYVFLCVDELGNAQEFVMCEGSEYGNACQEVI